MFIACLLFIALKVISLMFNLRPYFLINVGGLVLKCFWLIYFCGTLNFILVLCLRL